MNTFRLLSLGILLNCAIALATEPALRVPDQEVVQMIVTLFETPSAIQQELVATRTYRAKVTAELNEKENAAQTTTAEKAELKNIINELLDFETNMEGALSIMAAPNAQK